MPKFITEALGGATVTGTSMLIDIITPGWGSSGFYAESVLEQAATDRVFPKGTQMHIDHPTFQEGEDRPERSLHTLAAVLQEDARFTDGKLVAKARTFPMWRESLNEMKDTIGASIRAAAEFEFGEAEGRKGPIVERLVPSILNTVDFVTHAGRGGKIAQVLESAKMAEEARNIGQWLEARMHSMFTNISDEFYGDGKLTREERITLSGALGDALVSFTAKVEAEAPQLFERDLWEDATAVNAVSEHSTGEPANTPEENQVATVNIDETELTQLRADAAKAETLEQTLGEERAQRETDKAAEALKAQKANEALAVKIVASAFGATEAKVTQRALVFEAMAAESFNAEALETTAREAAAELAVAAGAGSVRGIGSTEGATHGISREASDKARASAFGRTIKEA